MGIRRDPEPGRQAVLWLATSIVILIGAAGCAFIVLIAVEQPSRHLMVWGAIFGGLIVALLSMVIPFDRQHSRRWLRYLFAAHRKDSRNVLRIGRKPSSAQTEYGTNAPPTLESVREASDQNVTWVPHGPPPHRPRRQ